KEVLPNFSGTHLDDLVDFLTYTCLPLLLLWRAEVLPPQLAWCWLVPLLASAYGFCQVAAKTADGYFLGFPSLWNVVALYLYLMQWPVELTVGVTWLLAFLTFVPSRYLYPSRGRGWLNRVATWGGVVWAGVVLWILARMVEGDAFDEWTRWLALASLTYPAYYLAASWVISVRFWRGAVRSRALKRELRE